MESSPPPISIDDLPRVDQLERLVRTLEHDLSIKTRANDALQRRIDQLEDAVGRTRLNLLAEIERLQRLVREQGAYITQLQP